MLFTSGFILANGGDLGLFCELENSWLEATQVFIWPLKVNNKGRGTLHAMLLILRKESITNFHVLFYVFFLLTHNYHILESKMRKCSYVHDAPVPPHF